MENSKRKKRIESLKKKIADFDKLSENNPNNIHNLSTSKRTDWVMELSELRNFED